MRKFRIFLGALAVICLGVGIVWLACHQPEKEMMVQGRTESDWIKSIVYYGPPEQTEAWRKLGQPGLQMLVRALWRGNGKFELFYRDNFRRLPRILQNKLPPPHDDTNRIPRANAAYLLSALGTNAGSVAPQIAQALKSERDESVLQIEFGCFGDAGGLLTLPKMDRVKSDLLPVIIRVSASKSWATRCDALIPLRYYTNQSKAIVPLLIAGLKDPSQEVRLAAASSLRQANPRKADEAGGVDVLIELFKTGNQSTSQLAARELGQWHAKPELVVPVLIEAVRGANGQLAMAAIIALGNFPADGRTAPALEAATQSPLPMIAWQAKYTLQKMTNEVSGSTPH